jgi:hypothetical protein
MRRATLPSLKTPRMPRNRASHDKVSRPRGEDPAVWLNSVEVETEATPEPDKELERRRRNFSEGAWASALAAEVGRLAVECVARSTWLIDQDQLPNSHCDRAM